MRRFLILAILCAAGAAGALALRSPAPEPVTLSGAVAQVIGPDAVRVTLNIENGTTPQRLVAVSSPEAAEARIAGGADLAIPAGGTPVLAADGAHLVLTGIEGPLETGRLLPIALEFDPSGTATTRARLEPSSDPHAMHKGAAEADVPPQVALTLRPEGDGWAVRVETQDFTFTPEQPDPQHIPGEGHGHLYLNGLKLQRVYGPDLTIGALPPGRYEVTVSLNGNTHLPYMAGGQPVAARAMIEVD